MKCICEANQQAVLDALTNRNFEAAELLLRQGFFRTSQLPAMADEPATSSTRENDHDLKIVASRGEVAAFERLLAASHGILPPADLSEALFIASARGHTPIVRKLLLLGAPINAKDSNGRTALHYATASLHKTVIDLLAEGGASFSIEDDIGTTPIDLAVHYGRRATEIIETYIHNLQLNISRRPSALEAANAQSAQTAPIAVRTALSGSWAGHYECLRWSKGRQDPFSIDFPQVEPRESQDSMFTSNNREDIIGGFQIYGFVDQVGVVWFVKLYSGHGWLYRGHMDLEKGLLKGTWGRNRRLWAGTFELSRQN